jgi:hypothetical protein
MATTDSHPPQSSTGTGPGIVIFDGALHLRYANQRARDLSARTGWLPGSALTQQVLPLEIIDLGARIREQLSSGRAIQDWGQFEMNKTIAIGGGSIRLQAFGVPSLDSFTQFNIMVVIEG